MNSQNSDPAPGALHPAASFIEHPASGSRSSIHTTLLEERIIFLGAQVDDAANDIMAQLLVLESLIRLPISPCTSTAGRWVHLADGDYDTMQYVRGPIL